MSNVYKSKVLLVDADPTLCKALALRLNNEGYAVASAVDGLDALLQLKTTAPDLIVSDLNMPLMSGFEFLAVVRLRFPAIPVIAMSGDYSASDRFPGGLIADAFYAKRMCPPEELLQAVARLVHTRIARAATQRQPASIQMPRYGRDFKGVPFGLLTCTECLRSFSLSIPQEVNPNTQEARCKFCATPVRYVSGYPLLVVGATALTVSRQRGISVDSSI